MALPRKKVEALPAVDPTWYKDAVIYQLHVKSFYDSNGDGIGDFAGLIDRLDYIADLGVDAIWLLPFYPSPRRDDGYDIADYRSVHPDYGRMADAKKFIHAAHDRGIRVIAEIVVNHTSDQHPWFQRARRAKPGSVHRNYYVWSDTDQAYDGTRVIFCDTEKSNWTWDPVAGAYFWHRFYSHQPDLNYDNPKVIEEVLSIMHFWLDLGIDGVRLDAVPYLVEREGTSNENLPETHEILKLLRADMDRHYPGRMLLAEANQWPEDTQEYFGKGDECHMAFHFPLMPRMYMAIAKEDRFPVTDIMRQTPEIPETCQWAIFLRNHDELTLEMVTDSERDYLWQVYASERRARINLGIRRRLSPLLERDRRRIELMNSLLFSMPGTPIIYYGDEIGMGDNIHLGDRDGVRTPMQWSPDRNGGFSRADPERLVLPAIMDSLYGYTAVNVESQRRDPHSLLNWTRRMLAVRRRHKAFGRGTLRFLYPKNRKVLAYVREYEGETILCVANLARAPHAVELDLSAFTGAVPVEMTGGTAFPPIGQLPYLLTLPPYGFLWFHLARDAQYPSWHTPAPEMMPEFATLVIRRSLSELLAPAPRAVLEGESLPAYLAVRRWFATKDRRIVSTRIAAATPLAVDGEELLLAEVETEVGNTRERYLMPLGIAWDDPNLASLPQQLALARVRRGRRMGYLTDAIAVERLLRGTLRALKAGGELPIDGGVIRFEPTARLAETEIPDDAEITWLSAEQSNSSVIVGPAILKLLRRITPGEHPEAEISRHLTEQGFENAPPLLGHVVRVDADGTASTLMLAHGFVRNQGDAWAWTSDQLGRVLHEVVIVEGGGTRREDALRAYETFIATVGRRLGEFHEVMARPVDDPDFGADTATARHGESWARDARDMLAGAFAILDDWTDDASRELARRLLDRRQVLLDTVDRLAAAAEGTRILRIHGDFHLGQVLVVRDDAYLIDFEGEPGRPLAERRAKTSPWRDVAGLLRSIDYAAAVAGRETQDGTLQQGPDRVADFLEQFRQRAEAAFLAGYRGATMPDREPDAAEQALLDLFLLTKAAYELRYEAANRPAWIGLPLRGLIRVADRLAGAHD